MIINNVVICYSASGNGAFCKFNPTLRRLHFSRNVGCNVPKYQETYFIVYAF